MIEIAAAAIIIIITKSHVHFVHVENFIGQRLLLHFHSSNNDFEYV